MRRVTSDLGSSFLSCQNYFYYFPIHWSHHNRGCDYPCNKISTRKPSKTPAWVQEWTQTNLKKNPCCYAFIFARAKVLYQNTGFSGNELHFTPRVLNSISSLWVYLSAKQMLLWQCWQETFGFNKGCLCVCVQSMLEQGVIVALSSNLTKDTAFRGKVYWLEGETNQWSITPFCDPCSVIEGKC